MGTDLAGALALVDSAVSLRGKHYFCFCEANLLSQLGWHRELKAVLDHADGVFADGVAIELLAWAHGIRLPGRVPGPSFMQAAMEYGRSREWRHFLLGGAEGVAESCARRFREMYPGVQIVGTYSPPFPFEATVIPAELRARIESTAPHLLWVGLGGPKQELWVAANREHMAVPVMLPVGAAFDFHSGHRPWAPRWIRSIGMEWAFRMLTGGRRTLFRNMRCVPAVAGIILSEAARSLRHAAGKRQ
jgi:N-acetylglucosaminyldiphosphoundecaprenol N-acetyl-beta-D-mannosaminyltransferase